MTAFAEFLGARLRESGFTTEDVVASVLPLFRQAQKTHERDLVAPLNGTEALHVLGVALYYEEAAAKAPSLAPQKLPARRGRRRWLAAEIHTEEKIRIDIDRGESFQEDAKAADGEPRHLGYRCYEHELGHHDALTDIYSLGMILASLALSLDFSRPKDLELFRRKRENPFQILKGLHPVIAQCMLRMTELDRERRAQDLDELIACLENYRDYGADIELSLLEIPEFAQRDPEGKRQILLDLLEKRLFETTRRNRLLHFKPTMQSLDLTEASVPLVFDYRSIREEQILVHGPSLEKALASKRGLRVSKFVDFDQVLYAGTVLTRIGAEARRMVREVGCSPLRLVLCFLRWTDLRSEPFEHFDTPLLLLPVELVKKKGSKGQFEIRGLSHVAELNPVLRQRFLELYSVKLPESVELGGRGVEQLYDYLVQAMRSKEGAVTIEKIDRPKIGILHKEATRSLAQFRRRSASSKARARRFGEYAYSYATEDFRPLGIQLHRDFVARPESELAAIAGRVSSKQDYAFGPSNGVEASDTTESSKQTSSKRTASFYEIERRSARNPYHWDFDLCAVTLANFSYRKMALVRDYEDLLESELRSEAFEDLFRTTPRELVRLPEELPELAARHLVVPADDTQTRACAWARANASYIIQGPPGTGKSQTITNLIADYLARGKRVLFVCEKRAAIDVVHQRLVECGLSTLSCLVHDSAADKKEFIQDLKRCYEAFLDGDADDEDDAENTKLHHGATRARDEREELLGELEQGRDLLAGREQLREASGACASLSIRTLEERCLRAERVPDDAPAMDLEIAEDLLPAPEVFDTHRDALDAFDATLGELGFGCFAEHPLARLRWDESAQVPGGAGARISQVREENLRGRFAEAVELQQMPAELLGLNIASFERLCELLKPLRRLAEARLLDVLDPKSAKSGEVRRLEAELEDLERRYSEAWEAAGQWRVKPDRPGAEAMLVVARRVEASFFAIFRPDWWRLRKWMRQHYDESKHPEGRTWVEALSLLRAEREAAALLEGRKEEASRTLCDPGVFRNIDELRSCLEELGRALRDQDPDMRQAIATLEDLVGQALPQFSAASVELLSAHFEACADAEARLARVLEEWQHSPRETLASVVSAGASAHKGLGKLQEIEPLRRLLPEIDPALGRALAILPRTPATLEAMACAKALRRIRATEDSYLPRNDSSLATMRSRLAERLEHWLDVEAELILEEARARFLDHVRASERKKLGRKGSAMRIEGPVEDSVPSAAQDGFDAEARAAYLRGRKELEHEFGKKQRYKSSRQLFEGDTGLVLKDLKPVWLMSPSSVCDTLPLDTAAFDVVIFDEASQITLEEAIPSLFRSAQCIVVGDEMQLPPTRFFAADRDEESFEFEEDGQRWRMELEHGSLLSQAARQLPSCMLGWHYRSRSESLISFSNAWFYDGMLRTVPEKRVPGADIAAFETLRGEGVATESMFARPISFHALPKGSYRKGRNAAEAQYIAELVRSLLNEGRGLSMAVVAFSEAQQSCILDALESLATEDRDFADALEAEFEREEDGEAVGLIVKNLENIQGDERDLVIVSVCYGADSEGKLRMNFGPINQSFGEKRLNVAFSRAKQHMAVVSTMGWQELGSACSQGAKCLRDYLRYSQLVSEGKEPLAKQVLRSVLPASLLGEQHESKELDPLARSIRDGLERLGFEVDASVGQSGFRCDLALRRPGDSQYRLAILLPESAASRKLEVLEREIQRPRLLAGFGWRVEIVLAAEWILEREAVVARLMRSFEQDASD